MINILNRVAGACTTNLLTIFFRLQSAFDHVCHNYRNGGIDLCFSSRECSPDSPLISLRFGARVEVLACQWRVQAVTTKRASQRRNKGQQGLVLLSVRR